MQGGIAGSDRQGQRAGNPFFHFQDTTFTGHLITARGKDEKEGKYNRPNWDIFVFHSLIFT